jgi:Na+-driven multidrug efflux pump
MDYTAGAIRGMGKSIVPMIISLIGACGLRVVWVFTVFKFWNTTTSLYISYPISWLLTFIALFIYTTIVRRNMTQGERVRQLAQQNS